MSQFDKDNLVQVFSSYVFLETNEICVFYMFEMCSACTHRQIIIQMSPVELFSRRDPHPAARRESPP